MANDARINSDAAERGAWTPTRQDVEEFLFYEAELLDDWRLEDWLNLCDDTIRYVIPNTDNSCEDAGRELMLIDDDYVRLRARIDRLRNRHAHREFPSSKTRRLIGNVRIIERRTSQCDVRANFIVSRARNQDFAFFVGEYFYELTWRDEGDLRITRRQAVLSQEALRPHGTLSILL